LAFLFDGFFDGADHVNACSGVVVFAGEMA